MNPTNPAETQRLREYWKNLCERQEKSQIRGQRILRQHTKIESRLNLIEVKANHQQRLTDIYMTNLVNSHPEFKPYYDTMQAKRREVMGDQLKLPLQISAQGTSTANRNDNMLNMWKKYDDFDVRNSLDKLKEEISEIRDTLLIVMEKLDHQSDGSNHTTLVSVPDSRTTAGHTPAYPVASISPADQLRKVHAPHLMAQNENVETKAVVLSNQRDLPKAQDKPKVMQDTVLERSGAADRRTSEPKVITVSPSPMSPGPVDDVHKNKQGATKPTFNFSGSGAPAQVKEDKAPPPPPRTPLAATKQQENQSQESNLKPRFFFGSIEKDEAQDLSDDNSSAESARIEKLDIMKQGKQHPAAEQPSVANLPEQQQIKITAKPPQPHNQKTSAVASWATVGNKKPAGNPTEPLSTSTNSPTLFLQPAQPDPRQSSITESNYKSMLTAAAVVDDNISIASDLSDIEARLQTAAVSKEVPKKDTLPLSTATAKPTQPTRAEGKTVHFDIAKPASGTAALSKPAKSETDMFLANLFPDKFGDKTASGSIQGKPSAKRQSIESDDIHLPPGKDGNDSDDSFY